MHDDVTSDLNEPDDMPRSPDGRLLPGSPVSGDYAKLKVPGCTLLSVIGHGGMGVVFLARQERLHRFVAVKMLTGSSAKDKRFLRHLEGEARTLATMSHPNIVGCHDIITTAQGTFLIMAFVPGKLSAQDLLTRFKQLPEPVVARIALDTARGLSYAHEKGISHRDIKPDNLLLYRECGGAPHSPEDVFCAPHARVMICDFGIAREHESDDGSDHTILGSPTYMAPEQAFDLDHADHHADMYALGSTLYHLLTGKRPFEGRTSIDTLRMKLDKDLPDPRDIIPGLTEECAHILHRMGARHPEERYASYEEMLTDLEHWTALHHTRPPGSILGRYPPSFWRGMGVGVAGVLFLLLLGGAGVLLKHHFTPKPISRAGALSFWDGDTASWQITSPDEETPTPSVTGRPTGKPIYLKQALRAGTRVQLRIRLPGDGIAIVFFEDDTGIRWRFTWSRYAGKSWFVVNADGRRIPVVDVADCPLMDWLELDLRTETHQININVDGHLRGVAPLKTDLASFRLGLDVRGRHTAQFNDIWITNPETDDGP